MFTKYILCYVYLSTVLKSICCPCQPNLSNHCLDIQVCGRQLFIQRSWPFVYKFSLLQPIQSSLSLFFLTEDLFYFYVSMSF